MIRITFILIFISALLGMATGAALAQLTPQTGVATAPPTPPNPKATLSGIGDAGGVTIFIQQLLIDNSMESKIESTLLDDLKKKGLTPGSDTHLYFVRIFGNDSGYRELHSYQYLAKGKSFEDALRESFAQQHGRGSSDILEKAPPAGDKQWGVYFSAVPKDGSFTIMSEHLDKTYYDKIRSEGMDLRDKRAQEAADAAKKAAADAAEKERIQKLREHAVSTTKAGDAPARERLRQLQRVPNMGTAGRSDGSNISAASPSPGGGPGTTGTASPSSGGSPGTTGAASPSPGGSPDSTFYMELPFPSTH
jgi:hypothetical protein